jgi:hypothetical protein
MLASDAQRLATVAIANGAGCTFAIDDPSRDYPVIKGPARRLRISTARDRPDFRLAGGGRIQEVVIENRVFQTSPGRRCTKIKLQPLRINNSDPLP